MNGMSSFVRRGRSLAAGLLASALLVALTGCTKPKSVTAAAWDRDMAPLWAQAHLQGRTGEPQAIVTLGAGDALGWQIHTNDVVLAAIEELRGVEEEARSGTFATVPTN